MTSAVCLMLAQPQSKRGGTTFYSSAQMMGMTVGNMFSVRGMYFLHGQ